MLTKVSIFLDYIMYPRIKSFVEFTQKFISYDPAKVAPHVCFLGVVLDALFKYFFWHQTMFPFVMGIILDIYIVYGFLKSFSKPTNEIGFLSARVWHLTEMQIVFYLGFILAAVLHRDIKSFNADCISGLFFIFSIFFLSYIGLCMMEFPPSKKKEIFFNNLGWQF